MRKINLLFLTLSLLLLTGCEDKKTDENSIPIENTTEYFDSNVKVSHENSRFKVEKKDSSISASEPTSLSDTFTLKNMKQTIYTVNVSNQKVTFKENSKAIKLITFFATWCPPCVHEIPYMNDLQQKYQKDLLLSSVLIHDEIDKDTLKSFLAKNEVQYFMASGTHNNDFASLIAKTLHLPNNFPIPLSVIYVEGKYFTHYEGCVPIEMIEYDIDQALKMLKEKR